MNHQVFIMAILNHYEMKPIHSIHIQNPVVTGTHSDLSEIQLTNAQVKLSLTISIDMEVQARVGTVGDPLTVNNQHVNPDRPLKTDNEPSSFRLCHSNHHENETYPFNAFKTQWSQVPRRDLSENSNSHTPHECTGQCFPRNSLSHRYGAPGTSGTLRRSTDIRPQCSRILIKKQEANNQDSTIKIDNEPIKFHLGHSKPHEVKPILMHIQSRSHWYPLGSARNSTHAPHECTGQTFLSLGIDMGRT
ncbi:hypothetical protein CEXT_619551 [Caerostris extrusa]|uniref:Uncharacterized protein n=1 Tax=Caerostris extrusa TaxID=172846 RepID=A0AAV4R1L2_CAEEX|nr:hypothetical protein CEXT_619551 [Caerostris extrusa]